MKKYVVLSGISLLAPSIVLAAGLEGIIDTVANIIRMLVPVVISAAVLFLLYGLAMYIYQVGEEKEKGKDIMIYGIIALFVMVSIWGLVNLLSETFLGGQSIQAPGSVETLIPMN